MCVCLLDKLYNLQKYCMILYPQAVPDNWGYP